MSYREVSMLEIKEVLGRREAGSSARRIARNMGMDRKMVGCYLEAIAAAGVGDAMEVDDEVLSGIGRAVQERPAVTPSAPSTALSRQRAQIEAWLGQKPLLRLTHVHKLLSRKRVAAGHTTLRRYVTRELGWRRREPTVMMADPPQARRRRSTLDRWEWSPTATAGGASRGCSS